MDKLHILTYDMRGVVVATGQPKDARQTGIVAHTHHLLSGLATLTPRLRLGMTQTGAADTTAYHLQVPEGQVVLAQGVRSDFPEYLRAPHMRHGKDKARVQFYYEEMLHDVQNPLYRRLAEQYAKVITVANIPTLLSQNPNPTIGILKAEELGYLDEVTAGQLNLTAVMHDISGYEARLRYISERLELSKMDIRLIAVSEAVRRQMLDIGIPDVKVTKIANGLDVTGFRARLDSARSNRTFRQVEQRNRLPRGKRMLLVPARRAEHKGQIDAIRAMSMLDKRGLADDMYLAASGNGMLDTRSLNFQGALAGLISELGLEHKVFLLDSLSDEEMISCLDAAHISILASTEPEGFAYANIEAMLAGTPVITSELGGPLDYIEHERTGLFVQPHDPAGIARAIERLMFSDTLHGRVSRAGAEVAECYTIEAMTEGYLRVIGSGRPRLPIRIDPGRPFRRIGEGMHTTVYQRGTSARLVIQVFKPERSDLTLTEIDAHYRYLTAAYASIPDFVPAQRLFMPHRDVSLHEAVLIKEFVPSDPRSNTLLKIPANELNERARDQLWRFLDVTRAIIMHGSSDPALRQLGPLAPDIIDPNFENLLIDHHGRLRLVDTNRLISTSHLVELAASESKLDIERRWIHALLLRRMMYLESKFFGRTKCTLALDPFYSQFVGNQDFSTLYEQSASAGEPIAD
jgi:hypothetical protein